MPDVQLNDTNQGLKSILAQLAPGEEVAIVDNGKRVAVLRKDEEPEYGCKAGSAAGTILFMAEDFDEPLDDFSEYMS